MKNSCEKNIIFIGGIHGVGKTTLCKKISKQIKLEHYSASDLISRVNSLDIKDDKKVNNINKNQDFLLYAVNNLLDKHKKYLIDGHFCLINSDGTISKVPLETFMSLNIKRIIVLVDETMNILNKIENRDSKKYDFDFIESFQQKEIEYAQSVANQIGVKCSIVNLSFNEDEFVKSINQALDI